MSDVIVERSGRVTEWVESHLGCGFGKSCAVGLIDEDGTILAGVVYENYNGANCDMHVVAVPGRRWATREYLWKVFYFPFVENGCERVTAYVHSTNFPAIELNQRLGFELEAVLFRGCPDGHKLVFRMFRENCKWLSLFEGEENGKEQGTESA